MVLKKRKFTVSFSKSLKSIVLLPNFVSKYTFFSKYFTIFWVIFFFFRHYFARRNRFKEEKIHVPRFRSRKIRIDGSNFASKYKFFQIFRVIFDNFFFRHYFARHNRSVSIPFRKKKKTEIRSMRNLNRNSRRNLSFRITNFVYALCF